MKKGQPITIEDLPRGLTPDRLPKALFETPYFFLLESSLNSDSARYSIAAFDPLLVFETQDGSQDPFDFLKNQMRQFPVVEELDLPFAGGWIGYLGYELYSHLDEKVPPRKPDLIPRAVFCFYTTFYLFDHQEGQAKLISTNYDGKGEGDSRSLRGLSDAANLKKVFADRRAPAFGCRPPLNQSGEEFRRRRRESPPPFPSICSNFSHSAYLDAIHKIKNYIAAGDCYQVNLSQRLSVPLFDDPYAIYQRLRAASPSPYGGYLNLGDAQILSSSPECFLKLEGRQVITRPIKGTRPRGKNGEEDQRLRKELEESLKDRAELLMITDLERNDLGRVCHPGTINVPELSRIESYPQVHHQVATIRGELAPDKDAIDLLKATFPGGSITGAPKVRAMQIIRELEPDPRNVYCGAIGFLSLNGKAQFNVAIRTMILKDRQAHFWAGGGIVADSDPEAEYEETLVKAQGMREALGKVSASRDLRSSSLRNEKAPEGTDRDSSRPSHRELPRKVAIRP